MAKAEIKGNQYESVDASPVKSFFVSMLTRDIKLEEAILDLLDNCVDGILRSNKQGLGPKPYKGFKAEIEFKQDSFMIADNCGGIPWSLHSYAFRMGRANDRPTDAPGTVGAFGIGMKRAIFKLGEQCLVSTKSGPDQYELEISPEWMTDEADWNIPVKAVSKSRGDDGTTIFVGSLHSGVAARFSADAKDFERELRAMVATHYAFIIDKGFEVVINGMAVIARPTKFIFDKGSRRTDRVQPFMFRTRTEDGVEVFLAVGFTRGIPSDDEVESDQEGLRYSSEDAGWTVICNDRAVLYCDRTELTGWGEAGVPRYHTQFIAISGVVEFRCDDASKLPTTTTKRGIDAASPLYLQIKNKMREGMRHFINYTNSWKGRTAEGKAHIEKTPPIAFEDVKSAAKGLSFRQTLKLVPRGEQFKPSLPLPKKSEPTKKRISFSKSLEEIQAVALHLFDDEAAEPSVVGERCFDLLLREARK